MVDDRTDPGEQIPEADLLEQQTPLDPLTDTTPEWPQPLGIGLEADEADRWEQAAALPDEEADDYLHQPPGGGQS
jgi:hypothetical protein